MHAGTCAFMPNSCHPLPASFQQRPVCATPQCLNFLPRNRAIPIAALHALIPPHPPPLLQHPVCYALIPELFPNHRTAAMAAYNSAIYVGRALSFAVVAMAVHQVGNKPLC